MKALLDCREVVGRRIDAILKKIERAGYEADEREQVDKATWIYQLLLRELDAIELPDGRKISLLLKISRFYQRTNFHVESERTLEKVASLRGQTSHPLSTEEFIPHAKSLEKTSMAATDAYTKLPQHELPMELHGDPCPALHRAFQQGSSSLRTATLLAAKDRPPPVDILGQSIIHAAALVGDSDLIKQLRQAFPTIAIDHRDSCRRTPLSLAATSDHLHACETLLEYGADKNARNIAYHSVVELAARCGHLDIVKLLCNHGADIEPTHMEGTSTALQAAAEAGHIEVVQYLLSDQGADMFFRRSHDDLTAEEIARQNGHKDIVKLLQSWQSWNPDSMCTVPADAMCDMYSP